MKNLFRSEKKKPRDFIMERQHMTSSAGIISNALSRSRELLQLEI